MAARGAHLTANLQIKPSIFEVIAQESLNATVHPALKKLATFLAIYNPGKLGWLYQWYEETYFTLNALLQYYYIKTYSSTFAEAFYGLRRICVSQSNSNTNRLPGKQEILSLICVVLLPYLKSKIDAIAERKKLQVVDHPDINNNRYRFLKYGLQCYNVFNATYQCLNVAYLLRYMSNYSAYHSPLLHLCGLNLGYAVQNPQEIRWTLKDIISGKLGFTSVLGGILIRGVEVGAFFVQFLQWWDSERFKLNITALPNPPAPQLNVQAEKYRGKCPICLQDWRVPTALQVSGFVFCYRCILFHLQNNNFCPVTQYPAKVEDLIRLFENGG